MAAEVLFEVEVVIEPSLGRRYPGGQPSEVA